MEPARDSFFSEISSFIAEHKVLCILTLGVAIVGYSLGNLAGRAVSWLGECYGETMKTDAVGRKTLLENATTGNEGKGEKTDAKDNIDADEPDVKKVEPKKRDDKEDIVTFDFNPSVISVESQKIVEKPIEDDDHCIFIENESNIEDIRGRQRNQDEEAVYAALLQLGEDKGVPFASVNKGGTLFHFVTIPYQEHSDSQYFQQVNSETGETKIVRLSLRRQTEKNNDQMIALNQKLERIKNDSDVVQILKITTSNGDQVTVERRTKASVFTSDNLLRKVQFLTN